MANSRLEKLARQLADLKSLRNLFSYLNYDFEDVPVNQDRWSADQRNAIEQARIIASKGDYKIYYIRTNTDSVMQWKGIATKIIKANNGLCLVCSHNPGGIKWVFSSLSRNFSYQFSETRHAPVDIGPNSAVPKSFVDFLEKIRVGDEFDTMSIISQVSDAFDSLAIQIHDELTVNVFEALKCISEGIITNESNNMMLNENTLEEIRESVFILLYRLIFILYAEDRAVFPIDNTVYYNEFSIKWIKQELLLHSDQVAKLEKYQIQSRLWKFFKLIEIGSEDLGYSPDQFFMKSYYGRLFDRKIHSNLDKWNISNQHLLDAISLLTRTRDKNGNYFFLDYSALETRHLGSIYERLLEYHLTVKNKKIANLPNIRDRKSSGSYYTPQYIVNYIVESSIGPLIDDIVKHTKDPSDQVDKILDLNILDPAMGSGHFLVGATNYMAKRICDIECANDISEQHFVERKRDVARRCIYGVDLNPLAVDLAQVSLWLETLSSERPLSFLSAHLKHGNSLIGSDINSMLKTQTTIMESVGGGVVTLRKPYRNTHSLKTSGTIQHLPSKQKLRCTQACNNAGPCIMI